jgi:hypothetical protein
MANNIPSLNTTLRGHTAVGMNRPDDWRHEVMLTKCPIGGWSLKAP